MARQLLVTTAGIADTAPAGAAKINANFAELYAETGIAAAATYAIARTLSGVTTGDRLQVLGRTSQSDGGQGLFTWVGGGSTTVDDGYVLQAPGGTWQRVDPSPEVGITRLNAVWYNIKPTNSDVTNDAGFAKLKAQMQTSGTTTWRVFFPPGAYTYTNNRWLFGVRKYVMDAYDATFQCTSGDPFIVNAMPLLQKDFFDDSGDVAYPNNSSYANGYLINTANAGAASITTTTAADAGNFTPGMRVLLHGYDQQAAGYPPNMRYFEFKTVLTAVAGTGVVTFTDQVQQFYDSRWWDTANYIGTKSFGAPRIVSLERANFTQAKLVWIKGAGFLANPTTPSANMLQLNGDLVILEHVTAPAFNIALTATCLIRRSTFIATSAAASTTADKLVDKIVIEDSTLDAIAGGGTLALSDCVGTNSLSIIRSKLYGRIGQTSPRHTRIDDCDIIPATGSFDGYDLSGYPTTTLSVSNTRVYNTGGGLACGINPGVANTDISFTVGTVSGTNIQMTWNGTSQAIAYQIDYGMTLSKSDGSKTGVITGIYLTGGNTLVITGTWSAPVGGETWVAASRVITQSDGGGNSIIGVQVPFWRNPNQLFYPDSPVFTGTVQIKDHLSFPGLTGGAGIYALSYGIQHVANSINTFFEDANGISFQLGGGGLNFAEGTNAVEGQATLVGGTVVVSTTKVWSGSRVHLTRATLGGTPGHLSYTVVNFTSFTITSSSGTDTSTVNWWILNHA